MLSEEIQIRVRYAETDRMGLLHHANYFVYFEQGRTELCAVRVSLTRPWKMRGFSWSWPRLDPVPPASALRRLTDPANDSDADHGRANRASI
jgi:hypothetical protein